VARAGNRQELREPLHHPENYRLNQLQHSAILADPRPVSSSGPTGSSMGKVYGSFWETFT
jgi:hypothetical protein